MANVNEVEKAVEMGAEMAKEIPKVHVISKKATVGLVGLAIATGGAAYGVYKLVKYFRSKKGIIDGEILKAEEDPTEEK